MLALRPLRPRHHCSAAATSLLVWGSLLGVCIGVGVLLGGWAFDIGAVRTLAPAIQL